MTNFTLKKLSTTAVKISGIKPFLGIEDIISLMSACLTALESLIIEVKYMLEEAKKKVDSMSLKQFTTKQHIEAALDMARISGFITYHHTQNALTNFIVIVDVVNGGSVRLHFNDSGQLIGASNGS